MHIPSNCIVKWKVSWPIPDLHAHMKNSKIRLRRTLECCSLDVRSFGDTSN